MAGTTHELTQVILANLFDAEQLRLTKEIDDIITENQNYRGLDNVGVLFSSGFYDFSWFKAPKPAFRGQKVEAPRRVSLHEDLHERMQAAVDEKARMEHDRKHITQMLKFLLEPARSLQDIRDTLPEVVVEVIPDLRGMPRQRPVGFTLKHPIHKQQLDRVTNRMAFYVAIKLMY